MATRSGSAEWRGDLQNGLTAGDGVFEEGRDEIHVSARLAG